MLLLVGDGPDAATSRDGWRRGSASHGSVLFTGGVPWAEVPAYTDAGDVFAMPCRTRLRGLEPEAWGIVFLEAQACGLPVVVGRSGGAPETLVDPVRSRVTDTQDEVPSALVELLATRRHRVAEDAMVVWSWDRCSEQLSRLWERERPPGGL